jgi:hypothetical protein
MFLHSNFFSLMSVVQASSEEKAVAESGSEVSDESGSESSDNMRGETAVKKPEMPAQAADYDEVGDEGKSAKCDGKWQPFKHVHKFHMAIKQENRPRGYTGENSA